jgi:hypothetical protein
MAEQNWFDAGQIKPRDIAPVVSREVGAFEPEVSAGMVG